MNQSEVKEKSAMSTKVVVMLAVLAAVVCFAYTVKGITENQDDAPKMSSTSSTIENSTDEEAPAEDTAFPGADVDYNVQVSFIGNLVLNEWESTAELGTPAIIEWYNVNFAPAEDAAVTDQDGVPQNALEQLAASYFGITPEQLRADTDCYNEADGVYRLPETYESATVNKADIIAVVDYGKSVVFTIKATADTGDDISLRVLTVERTDEGFQYISCVSEPNA